MKKQFIRINEWVTDHAQKAYEKGNYIEALQVLHGWIENKLQELLILTGATDHESDISTIWDVANQVSLLNAAHVLFILSQLTETEYQMVIKFNGMRNQVIHKLYYEPYERIYEGVPKKQYDEAFIIGMKLADLLQRKAEEKIE